jgi:hypothetical protein
LSMSIVNGYVCFDCTDIDKARKGRNPAEPADGPPGKTGVAEQGDVATRDGSTASSDRSPSAPAAADVAAPRPADGLGRLVDRTV